MEALSQVTDVEIDVFIALTDLDAIRILHDTHAQQFVNQPKTLQYSGLSLPKPATNYILREGAGAVYPVIFFHGAFSQHMCDATQLPLDEIMGIVHRLGEAQRRHNNARLHPRQLAGF